MLEMNAIKDAPYEVSDCYIATQMMKYGEVIPGSVRRGYIKGTNIENGSRFTLSFPMNTTYSKHSHNL